MIPKNAGMVTVFQLAPSAPGLVLLARIGMAGAPSNLETLFLLLAGWAIDLCRSCLGGSAIDAVWSCLLDHRPGLAGAGFSRPEPFFCQPGLGRGCAVCRRAVSSWGPLASAVLTALWLLGLLSITALPFSPTWAGAGLYALPFQPLLLIFLAGQGLFLLGTLRQVLRLPPPVTGAERWVGALYLAGLFLILGSYFLVAWFTRPGTGVIGQNTVGWIETGISLVAIGLAVLAMPFYMRYRGRLSGRLAGLKTRSWRWHGFTAWLVQSSASIRARLPAPARLSRAGQESCGRCWAWRCWYRLSQSGAGWLDMGFKLLALFGALLITFTSSLILIFDDWRVNVRLAGAAIRRGFYPGSPGMAIGAEHQLPGGRLDCRGRAGHGNAELAHPGAQAAGYRGFYHTKQPARRAACV